jgi:hypothetical protein
VTSGNAHAQKKRPQPGEDGYGRLVRVQQGRGGDDDSRALEPGLNAEPWKGFRQFQACDLCLRGELAQAARRTQILPTGRPRSENRELSR